MMVLKSIASVSRLRCARNKGSNLAETDSVAAVGCGTRHNKEVQVQRGLCKKPWCTLFGTLVPALFDSIGTGSRIGAGKNFRVQVDN